MINFKNEKAKQVFDAYLQQVEQQIASLPENEKKDIRMEITAHIYDSMRIHDNPDEAVALQNALQKLGKPEEYIKPLVAERQVYQAAKSFNPRRLFIALLKNIGNGIFNTIKYIFFGFLYFLVFIIILTAICKIFCPHYIGFYTEDNGSFYVGYSYNITAKEKLGYWLSPILFTLGILLYFLITLLLKLFTKAKKALRLK